MRARFSPLLPVAVASALFLGGGEAKALIIRYDFDSVSEVASGFTGGTIEVTSLDQTLGAEPVTFTIEDNGATLNRPAFS